MIAIIYYHSKRLKLNAYNMSTIYILYTSAVHITFGPITTCVTGIYAYTIGMCVRVYVLA